MKYLLTYVLLSADSCKSFFDENCLQKIQPKYFSGLKTPRDKDKKDKGLTQSLQKCTSFHWSLQGQKIVAPFEAYSNWDMQSKLGLFYSLCHISIQRLATCMQAWVLQNILFRKRFPLCYHIQGLANGLFRYERNTRPHLILGSYIFRGRKGWPKLHPRGWFFGPWPRSLIMEKLFMFLPLTYQKWYFQRLSDFV